MQGCKTAHKYSIDIMNVIVVHKFGDTTKLLGNYPVVWDTWMYHGNYPVVWDTWIYHGSIFYPGGEASLRAHLTGRWAFCAYAL
jgi:hypothetical protein